MTIGVPRALLYYRYGCLWETFFRGLGCEVLCSEPTNGRTLRDGIRFSIDEACVSSKIYMGHVFELIGKCDLILVPRYACLNPGEEVCVKFNALYDIVRNTFPDARLLSYNIDVRKGDDERKGFLGMGRALGKSRAETLRAYESARAARERMVAEQAEAQRRVLDEDAFKVLVVTHPYNIHDPLLGGPVIKAIEDLGARPVFADMLGNVGCAEASRDISEHLYWTLSKELVGAIGLCGSRVDGILLLTAFPCGPDSLVNELIMRKIKNVPVAHIVLDELSGEAGLVTRIESFLDIIAARR